MAKLRESIKVHHAFRTRIVRVVRQNGSMHTTKHLNHRFILKNFHKLSYVLLTVQATLVVLVNDLLSSVDVSFKQYIEGNLGIIRVGSVQFLANMYKRSYELLKIHSFVLCLKHLLLLSYTHLVRGRCHLFKYKIGFNLSDTHRLHIVIVVWIVLSKTLLSLLRSCKNSFNQNVWVFE